MASGALLGVTAARADFTFPDGSSSVSGNLSATIAADVEPYNAVSGDSSFGPSASYVGEQFVPNGTHAGIVTYGVAATGVSATPQSIRAYSAAWVPSGTVLVYPNSAESQVIARESAMIDFTAIPELAGPSFLPLLLTYQLNGSLSVTGAGENDQAIASVGLTLLSEGYYDTLDYASTQLGDGSKLVSESLSVRIAAEPTENPLIYLATWEIGQTLLAQTTAGTALADFTHTTTLTSLTFGNGQSLEEFGVKVTYASGAALAPDLTLPELGGGGTQPVPEPASLTLLCTGALALLLPLAVRRDRGAGAPEGHRRGSGDPP